MRGIGAAADKGLDLEKDVARLTADLIDVYSVSGSEKALADLIENSLNPYTHLEVFRNGDAVVARTRRGRKQRVILAGHLDTVPLPVEREGTFTRGTVPSCWNGHSHDCREAVLYGRGATDMKGGVAIQLALAARLVAPRQDVTYIFYDHEEVGSKLNGLGRLSKECPQWLEADFGILLEPTGGIVEGGCNGSLRLNLTLNGKAAHSARAWMGDNAIHRAAPVLERLREYKPQRVAVDGLEYREGLNAVRIEGGIAGNVIPDECTVEINYRFSPDKTLGEAKTVVQELLSDFGTIEYIDIAEGARPGLNHPIAAAFLEAVGTEPQPKYGWTDVARLGRLGIPAINFGPGDALLAHSDDEHVFAEDIRACHGALLSWLR